MIRPAAFAANPQTAASNSFQKADTTLGPGQIQERAVQEFDNAVAQLREQGVPVTTFDDTPRPRKPDAIFPNNWLSTHHDGTVVTYPMFSTVRRQEIRPEILKQLGHQFLVTRHWALEETAGEGQFLEGTGSMVLDRDNRIAYACHSPRTAETLVHSFCERMNYTPQMFQATDDSGIAIYHTNVMMALLVRQAVVCLESVATGSGRTDLVNCLQNSGLEIIEITRRQMQSFAGNLLQIARPDRIPVIAMSRTAGQCLTPSQRELLSRHSELVELEIPTIERLGGGSVRCMLAEIFLPPRPRAGSAA